MIGGLSSSWHLLEKLADAWKEKPVQQVVSGGIAPSTRSEKSRSSVPAVDELPPEVVAPSLRKMQQSSGFGSSGGKAHSDSQLHQRDQGKTGSEGCGEPTGGDDTPDSTATTASKTKTSSPQNRGKG